ncbi:gluconokinase, partial [Proteus mirabilis]
KERKGHFFKPQMLITQFETLEEPTNNEPDVYEIDISPSLDNVIENVINTIESVTKPITEESAV